MHVTIAHLADDPPLSGAVVVVDVVRAFATSGALFAAGALAVSCVETLEQARALRGAESFLAGEDGGYRPPDFDHGNSPRDVPPLAGRDVVQRTSNGTRGLARARDAGAQDVLALAATNVTATARWLVERARTDVTVLCTGRTSEDAACATALRTLLHGEPLDPAGLREAVLASGPEHAIWHEPWFRADVTACADVDRYGFAMVGSPGGRGEVRLHAASLDPDR